MSQRSTPKSKTIPHTIFVPAPRTPFKKHDQIPQPEIYDPEIGTASECKELTIGRNYYFRRE
jgi:hypothetical protein